MPESSENKHANVDDNERCGCVIDASSNKNNTTAAAAAATATTAAGGGAAIMAETEAPSSSSADHPPPPPQQQQPEEPKDEEQQQQLQLQQRQQAQDFVMAIARADSRVVRGWKLSLLALLFLSMVGVAVAVYFYTYNSEIANFQVHFHDDSLKVLQALGGSLDLTLGAVDSLAVSMVSVAEHTNQTWPFVTLPDFAVRSAKIRALSHAVNLVVHPYVSTEDRAAWQEYTAQNNGWVKESMKIQKKDQVMYQGPVIGEFKYWDVIHDCSEFEKDPNRTGPYMPSWQASPVIPGTKNAAYNWDLPLHKQPAILALQEKHRVVIMEAYMIPDYTDPEQLAETEAYADMFSHYIGPDENPMEPVSDIFYPIIDTMATVVSVHEHTGDGNGNSFAHPHHYHPSEHQVYGILAVSIYWRDMIKRILPTDSNGIVVVFENDCNKPFTYQIDGPKVTFLGHGDLHDKHYDGYVQSTRLDDLSISHHEGPSRAYTGIPVNSDYCTTTVNVYPSQEMESDYTSSNPILFAVAAVSIFAVTSAVFLIYDRWVEIRQCKVVATALDAAMNVSLLEEKVQERTKSLEESNQQLEEANRQITGASAAQLQHFASMSHEIRTPLNCVVGLSSILVDDANLTSKQTESLRMILNSAELLRSVVDDVLDYAKLESGNFPVNFQNMSLQETLDTVVHSICNNEVATSKELCIRTMYEPSVPNFIWSDGRRLQQILHNLLGNAIKFSKDKGTVELRVSVETKPSCKERRLHGGGTTKEVEFASTSSNATSVPAAGGPSKLVRFVVKDYGRGIEEKDFEKIFHPFSQASKETSGTYGGTGLGLSITSKLAEALGGYVSVDSKLAEWSEFSVELPLRTCEATSNDKAGDGNELELHLESEAVDVELIASRLKNVVVHLVGPAEHTERVKTVFQQCNIDFSRFNSLDDKMCSDNAQCKNLPHVFLIHEDLVSEETLQVLSKHALKSALFTYGPTHSAVKMKRHYRSLEQVLPSVLLGDLADSVDEIMQSASNLNGEPGSSSSSSLQRTDGSSESRQFGHLKVLIAEDNMVNQKVLGRILERLGLKNVVTVDNGRKAVDREAAERFDVVLMDMQMPVMDGVAACKLICNRHSQEGGHPKATVIFVTAQVSAQFEEECVKAGASGFLSKPCNIQGVSDTLASLVENG